MPIVGFGKWSWLTFLRQFWALKNKDPKLLIISFGKEEKARLHHSLDCFGMLRSDFCLNYVKYSI